MKITSDYDQSGMKIDAVGQSVPFERIRRITGYLSGDVSGWNNAKKAEERARVKHGLDQRVGVNESIDI